MMNRNLSGWSDTIAAVATAAGVGAIAVIRLSGSESIAIVNGLFPSKNLEAQPSHTLHVGTLKHGGEPIDEVVVSIYKNPRSFTGEDVVEISCHGSVHVQQKIMDVLTASGARVARPGEFTLRAFLNGKMDLTQAEAVADMIASNTDASRRTALNNIRGGFSSDLKQLREELIAFSALIELELDFSQEDVEFADRSKLYALIANLKQEVEKLLGSFRLGNVIKNGVQVAIIGKPNAGKSTLLNTLLNENRAIVSDIEGTTRDTIEEVLNIEGILFRLIDTAGLRQQTDDIIEQIGVEKSMEKMRQADIVVYVFDVNTIGRDYLLSRIGELKQHGRYILVANKAEGGRKLDFDAGEAVIYISAKDGWHIDELKSRLVAEATGGELNMENTIISNARHFDALKKLHESVVEIEGGMDAQIPGDLLAIDIRNSLHYLAEITGTITNEDQLDFIFSKFCIGK